MPKKIYGPIRSIFTALLTPVLFSVNSGHFISSLKNKAVSRRGLPIPWYTYPAIDLLGCREFRDKTILEFGGGQSTLYWSKRAKKVYTIESDFMWFSSLKDGLSNNVKLIYIERSSEDYFKKLREAIPENIKFDVIAIDGDDRCKLLELAREFLGDNGVIICDDAESYDFYNVSKDWVEWCRVDFFGYSPGVVLPHCTSIFFKNDAFIFNVKSPIYDMAIQN